MTGAEQVVIRGLQREYPLFSVRSFRLMVSSVYPLVRSWPKHHGKPILWFAAGPSTMGREGRAMSKRSGAFFALEEYAQADLERITDAATTVQLQLFGEARASACSKARHWSASVSRRSLLGLPLLGLACRTTCEATGPAGQTLSRSSCSINVVEPHFGF